MTWEALPTVVRRTFDEYLIDYGERSGKAFSRSGEPREEEDGFAIPYRDGDGNAFEAIVSADGSVVETRRA